MKKNLKRILSIALALSILLVGIPDVVSVAENSVCLAELECIDEGHYTGNMGDARLYRLDGQPFVGFAPEGYQGRTFIKNTDSAGNVYENGFDVWIARWNGGDNISWAYRTFKLDGKYKTLTGKTSVLISNNTSNYDVTVYFYDGETLLQSFHLTPTDYKKEFTVDVTGAEELKVLVKDNYKTAAGTHYALYDLFLDGDIDNNNDISNISQFNNHYYKVFDEPMTWTEAETFCENLGGHLVTISSEEENDFVFTLVENRSKTYYWLGGTDEKEEGKWEWVTGETWDYSNWSTSDPESIKPNNEHGNQNYAHMYRVNVRNNLPKTWNDVQVNGDPYDSLYPLSSFGFVCEWDSNPYDVTESERTIFSLSVYGAFSSLIGCQNDINMFHSRMCNNVLDGYTVDETNQQVFGFDCDSDPTDEDTIENRIKQCFNDTENNDLSFFYFSGHSMSSNGIPLGLALAPSEWISWNSLANLLCSNIKGQIIVIIDACHSEYFISDGVENLTSKEQERFHVLTSCGDNETSKPNHNPVASLLINSVLFELKNYGVFSYYFGRGIGFFNGKLEADSKNGVVSIYELYNYILPKTQENNMTTQIYGNDIDLFQSEPKPAGNYPADYNFNTDRYYFHNLANESIPTEYFESMYGPTKGAQLALQFYNYGYNGTCFGMAQTTAATLLNCPYVNEYRNDSLVPKASLINVEAGTQNFDIGMTAKEYIWYGHLYQLSTTVQNDYKKNAGFENLQKAVMDYVDNDDAPVVVFLDGGFGPHCVFAIGYDGNDILVNDSNVENSITKIEQTETGWRYQPLPDAHPEYSFSSDDTRITFTTDVLGTFLSIKYAIHPTSNNGVFEYTDIEQRFAARDFEDVINQYVDADKILITDATNSYDIVADHLQRIQDSSSSVGLKTSKDSRCYWSDRVITATNTGENTSTIILADNDKSITASLDTNSTIKSIINEGEDTLSTVINSNKNNRISIKLYYEKENDISRYTINGIVAENNVIIENDRYNITISGLNDIQLICIDADGEFAEADTRISDGRTVHFTVDEKTDTIETDYVQDEPENPSDPVEQTKPTGENLCKYCGKDHSDAFLGRLIAFFHSILYFFAHMFGKM